MSVLLDAIATEISEREQRKATLDEELLTIDSQLAQLRTMAEQAQTLNGAGPSSPPAPGEQPSGATTTGDRPERDGRKDGNAPDGRRPQSAGRRSGSASSRSSRNGSDTRSEGGGTKRAAVLAYVAANGKVKVADICSALDLSAGATRQHLKTLVDGGAVQAEGATSARVYFTTTNGDQATAAKGKRRDLNITAKVRQQITDAIARDPGALTEDRLAQALGLDREQVADACGQLLEDDEILLGPDATYTISGGGGRRARGPEGPDPQGTQGIDVAQPAAQPDRRADQPRRRHRRGHDRRARRLHRTRVRRHADPQRRVRRPAPMGGR